MPHRQFNQEDQTTVVISDIGEEFLWGQYTTSLAFYTT